ncbi:hypothetical protein ABC345_02900 [Shouchella sp. 1P09AA]|uniref:hypothetical protein n=1 Tax=unclassified Shouchella TaxID=2893065 RepID=UPI0039A003E0
MKGMKHLIIIMSVVLVLATIINLVFSLRSSESSAIYSITVDFFLAGLFTLTIVFALIRNHKNDNRIMLAFMCVFPLFFLSSGVVGIVRLL